MGSSFDLYQKERKRIVSGILLVVSFQSHQDHQKVPNNLQSALEEAQKRAACKIARLVFQECLHRGDQTPAKHLDRDPPVRAEPFGDKLRRQLGKQEHHEEDGLAGVVVVGIHAQVSQHVVGHGLDDISSVQLECKKSDASKRAHSEINLVPNQQSISRTRSADTFVSARTFRTRRFSSSGVQSKWGSHR